jgi:integrase
MQNTHRRAVRVSGVDCRIYDLRHTFATRMAARGMPLPTLAAILGHASLRSIMRYVHPNQAIMDEAMLRFSTGV